MVSVDKFKDITWSVGADGTIITDDATNVQQIQEFLACKDSPTLLRLWVERYGGEWQAAEFMPDGVSPQIQRTISHSALSSL